VDAPNEVVVPPIVLDVEQVEVGREPLAEPDVVPVALGHAVAEPLMRNLVRRRASRRRAASSTATPATTAPTTRGSRRPRPRRVVRARAAVPIVDLARVLGGATVERRGHVRELLVAVGTDPVGEELERQLRRRFELLRADVAILMRDPRLELHALHVLTV